MKLKEALPQLLGKRICGAVVKQGDRSPRMQVFLIFDDDTYYELYSDCTITGAGGVDQGNLESVRQYFPSNWIVVECHTQARHMTQDLFAE